MARKGVHVTGPVAADPAAVWATLRDFCGLWHPAIATITAQRDRRGSLIRAFTVKGEAATCREQLTYFSDSDRTLAYSRKRLSELHATLATDGGEFADHPAKTELVGTAGA